ncbi:hypothetical protein F511_37204 [Dorcoceras hygrometricum]|uniref:Uncharacterized protein n=1 Tax=Dorcoceras hygrometricum TaxID=472368 RepID=A0A2Z7B6G3_9LAMI|nr:hypothetical protein F511_37204 [Dorcoceras hygrometricum]
MLQDQFASGNTNCDGLSVVDTVSSALLFTEPYLIRLPAVDSSDEGESGSVGLLLLRRFVWILLSDVFLKLVVDLRHCGNLLVVIVVQRFKLLHLHTRIILLSSVLLAVPVLLN